MKEFNRVIGELLKYEGGYVDDPLDAGGRTKYGISQAAYPLLDIKSLTRSQAKEIYFKDYWLKASCDKLPLHLQFIHFDTAVNSGVKNAAYILQKAIGTVKADGIIGPQTLAAAQELTQAQYLVERAYFYARIVKRKPTQLRFLVGWMNRLKKLAKFLGHE